MRLNRIAVIAVRPLSGEAGGAERFYQGLVLALKASGIQTDLINVIGDESSFEAIEETYLRCYDLDLSAYDAVISTKAPTYLVRHPNHICYLVHTMRVFYDMFDLEFPNSSEAPRKQRRLIHQLDTGALSFPRTRKVFTIGNEVSNRLLQWNRIESEVLHPALSFDGFRSGNYGNYIFMPGRLHRWKRVGLAIEAFRYVQTPVRLKIAGAGEDENILRDLASRNDRVEFLGRVSDAELVKLYSGSLAVSFVPIRGDYGYVTLEAFRSAKPVITCEDSGEATHFVKNGVNGFVCRPTPREIGRVIDHLFERRGLAKTMGEQGEADVKHICWSHISCKLISALQVQPPFAS